MLALPMDLRNPADALEEAMLYHRADRFGFVPLLIRTHDVQVDGHLMPVRPQHTYKLSELPTALRFSASMNDDIWITQNEFFRPNRRLVNLGRITLCFADLDYYKLSQFWHSPQAVAVGVLTHCANTGIPKPNLIIDSGRGLQIKWLIDTLPAAALPRWNTVQRAIGVAFKRFGSDARAQDASRVLRLVGTYNTRSRSRVRVIYADTQTPYSFDMLADALLPFSRQELSEIRAQRAEKKQVQADEKERRSDNEAQTPSGLRPLSIQQLWWDRLSDIRALKHLRVWDAVPVGYRDTFLWLAATALSWVLPPARVRQELAELGREFAGTMPESERIQFLSATLTRAEQAAQGMTIELDGCRIDPRYRFSNAKLIELLQVSPDEQRQLKTIISDEEAKQRHAARERARRAAHRIANEGMTRAEYLEAADIKRVQARKFRDQGWSIRRIAAELGISVGSAAGYCKLTA